MHDLKEDCLPLAFKNCLYPLHRQEYNCQTCKRYATFTFGMICHTMKNYGLEVDIPDWVDIGTDYDKEERKKKRKNRATSPGLWVDEVEGDDPFEDDELKGLFEDLDKIQRKIRKCMGKREQFPEGKHRFIWENRNSAAK